MLYLAGAFLGWLVIYVIFQISFKAFSRKPYSHSEIREKEMQNELLVAQGRERYVTKNLKIYGTSELRMADIADLIQIGVNKNIDKISKYGRVEVFGINNTVMVDNNGQLLIPKWPNGEFEHVNLAGRLIEHYHGGLYLTKSNESNHKPVHYLGVFANDDNRTLLASCFLLPDNSVIVTSPCDSAGAHTQTYDPAEVSKSLIATAEKGMKEFQKQRQKAKKAEEGALRAAESLASASENLARAEAERKEREAAEARETELKRQKAIEALKKRM